MTVTDEIAGQLQQAGYAVIPGLMSQQALATARAELSVLLDAAGWGSYLGFINGRHPIDWLMNAQPQ